MFRKHWKVQGKRVVYANNSLKVLKEKGLEFEDAVDFIKEKPPERDIGGLLKSLGGFRPKKVLFDETHPDYNESRCLTYGDHSVLLEGLKQAQVLTNTVLVNADELQINKDINVDQELPLQDKLVKRCIRSSLLYDATQEKLPKRHDPLREAWIFPRDFGITDRRRNYLLINRLLQLCSSFSPQLLGQRSVIQSAKFKVPVTLPSGQQIIFSVSGDAVVANNSPAIGLPKDFSRGELPDIYPLESTVSLESTNFYKFEHTHPVSRDSKLSKIHTVIIPFNETEVANIFESPVTTDQVLGRSLVHSWIIALSQAKMNTGNEVTDPVTIQAVQTDGKFFHFSMFQLSSTSLDPSTPNIFCSFPLMNIFNICSYIKGSPILEGYDARVFKTLLAFYNNS